MKTCRHGTPIGATSGCIDCFKEYRDEQIDQMLEQQELEDFAQDDIYESEDLGGVDDGMGGIISDADPGL